MATSPLTACPSCARHVRVTESACPFCHAAFSAPLHARSSGRAPVAGLSRAALFALGTGALALTPACSSSTAGPSDGGSQMADGPVLQPAYGGPPLVDAAYGGPPVDSGTDGGPMGEPAYGAPPLRLDASDDAPLLVDAAYGAPPGDF